MESAPWFALRVFVDGKWGSFEFWEWTGAGRNHFRPIHINVAGGAIDVAGRCDKASPTVVRQFPQLISA
jgi:hypothetical protein